MVDDSGLSSSRLLSMAEAVLDQHKPKWRSWCAHDRQAAKDATVVVLLRAYHENPVGERYTRARDAKRDA